MDVFYDEFIKFIPPYILKREEEKRKRLEGNSSKVNQYAPNRIMGGGASANKVGDFTMNSSAATNAA